MKLPLKIKQNVRDEFDVRLPSLQDRMEKSGLFGFAFVVDPEQLFPYVKEGTIPYTNFGKCIYQYFDSFVSSVEQYTEMGQKTDSLKAIQKVAQQYVVTLTPLPDDSNRFNYSGISIRGGQAWIHFNTNQFGHNALRAGSNLPDAIDKALDDQDAGQLPAHIQRGIKEFLDGQIPHLEAKFLNIFGKPYRFEADICKNYAQLQAKVNKMADPSYLTRLPEFVQYYFDSAARTLSAKNLEKDETLCSMFNKAVSQQIIRFEIVDLLRDESAYCDCDFADGEWKLQTICSKFGVNVRSVAENIVEYLRGGTLDK